MFLTPEILINIFLETLILLFLSLCFGIALQIVRYFDIQQDTPLQYALERRAYLVSTIIRFALLFKIVLFFYFIYTLDKLSNIIPGAMCAAGVVTSNGYGVWVFMLKLVNIYLFGFWILADIEDRKEKAYPFTKFKFSFFIFIFILVVAEYILEILYFKGLDVSKIVSCCGVLFNPVKSNALFALFKFDPKIWAALFYLGYILVALFALLRKRVLFAIANALFLLISIFAIIYFFSPYIYQLPTHHCPFCMLQKEYGYVGYIIYLFLFLGTYYGMAMGFVSLFLHKKESFFAKSLLFDTLTLLILSFYCIRYYYINHVWLF